MSKNIKKFHFRLGHQHSLCSAERHDFQFATYIDEVTCENCKKLMTRRGFNRKIVKPENRNPFEKFM